MYTKLLSESDLPEFDARIVEYVNQVGKHPYGSGTMNVGIRHNGTVYRVITTEGLGEYLDCIKFLCGLGLVDLLEKKPPVKGFDSLFEQPANG